MNWMFVGCTSSDSFILNGIDIFKEKWINTGKIVALIDPQYGNTNSFTVWQVKSGDTTLTFAAGEFSNGIFGIYIEK